MNTRRQVDERIAREFVVPVALVRAVRVTTMGKLASYWPSIPEVAGRSRARFFADVWRNGILHDVGLGGGAATDAFPGVRLTHRHTSGGRLHSSVLTDAGMRGKYGTVLAQNPAREPVALWSAATERTAPGQHGQDRLRFMRRLARRLIDEVGCAETSRNAREGIEAS